VSAAEAGSDEPAVVAETAIGEFAAVTRTTAAMKVACATHRKEQNQQTTGRIERHVSLLGKAGHWEKPADDDTPVRHGTKKQNLRAQRSGVLPCGGLRVAWICVGVFGSSEPGRVT
jgi:hypothetical protein